MNRRSFSLAAIAPALLTAKAAPAEPHVLRVGPARTVRTIAEAARIARDGDRVEVDAGDYVGDVAVWAQSNITIAAAGGRARLLAQGASIEGKGTWVVRGDRVTVEGFDFLDATAPHGNGAGIRFERGSLVVRDCTFMRNQTGIMSGNHAGTMLEVESCEFARNTNPDGQTHHLYAGTIGQLRVTGSYFHHADIGHLLKTRAAVNNILYNRLTDEPGGRASYELEFPVGGIATVIGNIISQTAQTDNPVLVSFGAEGYKWPKNELFLINNTLIDRRGEPGVCLFVKPGADAVRLANNLMAGADRFFPAGVAGSQGNVGIGLDQFRRQTDSQFRLLSDSALVGKSSAPGTVNGASLAPRREYVHPRRTALLATAAHNPGAMQSLANSRR